MQKNEGSYVVSANFNKLFSAIVLVNLFYVGFVNHLPESDLVYSTIDANSKFNNYSSYNTNFQANQTHTSELLIDSYYQIKLGDTIDLVMISSSGNKISALNYDEDENSIMLLLSPSDAKGNSILIDIPRNILDSTINGNDKNFTVMVDDQPAKFLEISNDSELNSISNSQIDNISEIQYSNNVDSRKLMIEFGADSKIIKISGTDTNNLINQSKSLNIPGNQTTQEKDGQQDIFFPILYIIVTVGIAVLYFLHRKNKLRIMRKTKSR